MAVQRSNSVVIATSPVNETFTEKCSVEEDCGNWQVLEQYWGEQKQRLQDFDGQTPKVMSNSLEDHLKFDDYIEEPCLNSSEDKLSSTRELTRISGEEINDIPTTYMISGFDPHELIVIGTYVDKRIVPGFRYKVRKNLTKEYLFDGQSLPLETVGIGYGKRLTFRGESLNHNDNFFWSDSRIHGYGFTQQSISRNDSFMIHNTTTNQIIGRVVINNPALQAETELTTTLGSGGWIEKKIKMHFTCDVLLKSSHLQQNIFVEDAIVKGEAVVIRNTASSVAKIEKINLDDFVVDDCQLLPE